MDSHSPYIDAFAEEIGQEITKLLDAAVRRHREAGGAADGAVLRRLRATVREGLCVTAEEILAEQLDGARALAGSGDDGELRKRFPGAFTRHIR